MAWGDLILDQDSGHLHAVLLPFPAWSHVAQILHFARQLVRQFHFSVTIVTSTHYYKDFTKSHSGSQPV
jgi:hypothetical protein